MRNLTFCLSLLIAACLAAPTFAASGTENVSSPAASEADRANVARLDEIDKAYRIEVVKALSASAAPRDRALAAVIDSIHITGASGSADKIDDAALIEQAAAAAPNDVLVQWIAMMQSERTTPPRELAEQALGRLQNLEPDNASVWMHALIRASHQHDTAAADAAVRRMAASTHVDDHFVDFKKALIEANRRYPLPDEYFRLASANPSMSLMTPQSAPYFLAAAFAAATMLPGYQPLIAACKPTADFQPAAARIDDCARIGRLMATKSDTLIANVIGFAVLRVSRSYTADDVKLARAQDWMMEKYRSIADGTYVTPAAKLVEEMDDVTATGSELEGMRRTVARENLPTEPPADWIDPRSPFSPERLRQDQAAVTNRKLPNADWQETTESTTPAARETRQG
jgi:hypothetical protein